MSWVVDTCIVIDAIGNASGQWGASADLLVELEPSGLVICPVSYVELAPSFQGDTERQNSFLETIGVEWEWPQWTREDTLCAHAAWQRQVAARHDKKAPRRPLADILIGAFAMRYEGLVTRNPSDFADIFPSLAIRVP